MLSLREIVKTYTSGDSEVHALQGVSIDFRESEFVSILGPSGCGKTTMLNIIGGLDRYTSGDLIINGRSTKEYRDADWDTYRNHSIGFVFQSYNLIMHQTVLANVELALTLSGVSREERRARAIDALEQVGLGDQLHKKPNQMSGGQMQRVAIARALVNDPDILLADEPTGALDTATSVQIMEILKKVSEKKLIIMVTHNPELAEQYSNRIIRVLDGQVTDDSNPYEVPVPAQDEAVEEAENPAPQKKVKTPKKAKKAADGKGKKSMSFLTALSLSFTNLLTKKTRTLLVSVAGSIGIIGIALILALSNGVNLFIAAVQEDTLSTYPLTIQKETQDMSAMLEAMTSTSSGADYSNSGKIYVDDSLSTMMSAMNATVTNNLAAFKEYIEANPDKIDGLVNDIQYTYDLDLQLFNMVAVDKDGKTVLEAREIGMGVIFDHLGSAFSGMSELMEMGGSMGSVNVFSEMINNQELLEQQYDVIAGAWPQADAYNEVVLVVNSNNQVSKMTLYMLGMLDPSNIEQELADVMSNNYTAGTEISYTFEELLNTEFKLLTTAQFFEKTGEKYTVDGKDYDKWQDIRVPGVDQTSFITENGVSLKVAGIIRPKKGVAATSISGAVGYTKALTDYILEKNSQSEIINQQKNLTPNHSVLNGAPFERTVYDRNNIDELFDRVGTTNMQRFYSIVTTMLRDDPQFEGIWSDKDMAITMYVSTLNDKKMAECIADLLKNAKETDSSGMQLSMLFSNYGINNPMLDGPSGVTVSSDNVVALLPVLSEKQIMALINGLTKVCSAETTDALFADIQSALKNGEWQVNEKFVKMMLESKNEAGEPLLNDEMFSRFEQTLYDMVPDKDATQESNLKLLDDAERAKPASINFYAKDFESKEQIEALIADYNANVTKEEDQLEYTDLVGTLMSSVTIIVDAISYVLIAFVSISLVVSSIMIGIITYISVLERTKEIGVLRAIGASKRDISRVFNAETLIIGFAAGAIGIITTVVLCLPINAILRAVTDMENIKAVLPVAAGFILVAISMVLTLIAGVIPSRIASKKDPVEALRSE